MMDPVLKQTHDRNSREIPTSLEKWLNDVGSLIRETGDTEAELTVVLYDGPWFTRHNGSLSRQ